MKKIFVILLINIVFCLAGLIDVTDQYNSGGMGLSGGLAFGENPAAPAYYGVGLLNLGLTGFSDIKQNSKILYKNGNDGKDLSPEQVSNKSLKYIFKLSDQHYFSLSYFYGRLNFKSYKQNDPLSTQYSWEERFYTDLEATNINYSVNINSSTFFGITLGVYRAGLFSSTDYNKAMEDQGICDEYNQSLSRQFKTINFGLIQKINDNFKFSFAQMFSEKRQIQAKSCNDDGIVYLVDEYNDTVPNTSALGFFVNPLPQMEIGLAQETVWGTKFVREYEIDKNYFGLVLEDMTIEKLPFNIYTLSFGYQLNEISAFNIFGRAGRNIMAYRDENNYHAGFDLSMFGVSVINKINPQNQITLALSGQVLTGREDSAFLLDKEIVKENRVFLAYSYIFEQNNAVQNEQASRGEQAEPNYQELPVVVTDNRTAPATELESAKQLPAGERVTYKLSKKVLSPGQPFAVTVIVNDQTRVQKGSLLIGTILKKELKNAGNNTYFAETALPADYSQALVKVKIYLLTEDNQLIEKIMILNVQ